MTVTPASERIRAPEPIHRTLQRQLRKCGIDPVTGASSPEAWHKFLRRVDRSYRAMDDERYTAQRALEISSREMETLSTEIEHDRAQLVAMVASLPQAVVFTDANGVIRFGNARAEELLGAVTSGGPLSELVLLYDDEGDRVRATQALHGPLEASSAHVRGRHGALDAAWTLRPMLSGDDITGILLVVTDLREVKRREAALQRAKLEAEVSQQTEAARGRFLANVSHELRTPLNAILGYAEMLGEDTDDPQTSKDIGRILQAGTHLLSLINDLLDLSKIDAGKLELSVDAFELEPLLDSVIATALPLAQVNHNSLELVCDPEIRLETDRRRLQQCLLNLLGNAAKFTSDGHISLNARRTAQSIVVEVVDTGIGIPDHKLTRIFDAFEQVGVGDQGTGLGLAVTKAFVERMGGTIRASSTVGSGSTFTIELPRRDA